MGIEHQDARALFRAFKRHNISRRGRLLVLGDAVVHFKYQHFRAIAEEFGVTLLPVAENLTPHSFGLALGFECVDTLDINGKANITADLQEELPKELQGAYDMVIDAGVLFWCFDPGLAIKNILRLAKPGALIFHITALTGYYGRGYYNIHPRLFEDFYLANGCVFLQSTHRAKPRRSAVFDIVRSVLWRLFCDGAKDLGVTYVDTPGAIFLGRTTRSEIGFQNSLSIPEANMLPNNAVSTFLCEKSDAVALTNPVQKC